MKWYNWNTYAYKNNSTYYKRRMHVYKNLILPKLLIDTDTAWILEGYGRSEYAERNTMSYYYIITKDTTWEVKAAKIDEYQTSIIQETPGKKHKFIKLFSKDSISKLTWRKYNDSPTRVICRLILKDGKIIRSKMIFPDPYY